MCYRFFGHMCIQIHATTVTNHLFDIVAIHRTQINLKKKREKESYTHTHTPQIAIFRHYQFVCDLFYLQFSTELTRYT